MKTYSILYAEDVPSYGTVEITAETDEDAIAQAKEMDFGDVQLDPEWNNAVCKRIVHIEDHTGKTLINGISLDNTILLNGSNVSDAIQYALESLNVFKPDWLVNHGLGVVIEKLQAAYIEVGGAA